MTASTQSTDTRVAQTIWTQLRPMTKLTINAQHPMADGNALILSVSKSVEEDGMVDLDQDGSVTHKLQIILAANDSYTVNLLDVNKLAMDRDAALVHSVSDIGVEMLNGVVLDMIVLTTAEFKARWS